MQDTHHIKYLLHQYLDDVATPPEQEELFRHIQAAPDDAQWGQLLQQIGLQQEKDPAYQEANWQKIIDRIVNSSKATQVTHHRVHFLRTAWFRYAAAVLLLFAATAYFFFRPGAGLKHQQEAVVKNHSTITPGSNKAILTLASGKQLVLDDASNGLVVQADGVELTTPRGGQYYALLPDGSKVWLNAASSIKFPAAFTGNNRAVAITGEVYLEVAKDKSKPFYVTTPKTAIQVLGTSFNIKAYEDEEIEKTTLVEGSIKIIPIPLDKGGRREAPGGLDAPGTILNPNEQAQVLQSGNIKKINLSDGTDQVMAWRNNEFQFDETTDIHETMRQVSRWYNVDVVYQGEVSGYFWGTISRTASLPQVLETLEKTGKIKFKLEGNKLTVMP